MGSAMSILVEKHWRVVFNGRFFVALPGAANQKDDEEDDVWVERGWQHR